MGILPLFDIVLVGLLLWLAWRLLTIDDLFSAAVLFISFGLLMSLAWMRLQAPDLALAEAAIGAGITGALVLTALGRLGGRRSALKERSPFARRPAALFLPGCALAVFGVLGWAVWSLPSDSAGLAPLVTGRMGESGVDNQVTAVLLNFRAYDTLLEIGVLFLAALGAWSMGEAEAPRMEVPGEPLLALVRLLLPLIVIVSAYLLWLGSHAPGGAFQGGAVLASMGVLLLLAGIRPAPSHTGGILRMALTIGFAFFMAAAVSMTAAGGRFLEYPPGWAKGLILLIESVLTLSIAMTLVLLFAGGRPPGGPYDPEGG